MIKKLLKLGSLALVSFFIVSLVMAYYINSQRHPDEHVLDLDLKSRTLQSAQYRAPPLDHLKRKTSYLGQTRSYYVYIPKNKKARMPVLLALHGGGRSGASMLDTWSNSAETHGFVVIAPDSLTTNWPINEPDSAFFPKIIEEVLQDENISPGEMYLFGHSSGAKKAITLALNHPGLFDGVVAHAGTLPFETNQDNKAVSIKDFKIALFLGSKDHIFSVPSARQTLRWLASLGVRADLYVFSGHSHWYYDDAFQINELAWEYLRS